jgi:sugar/nucleoside kinase (ribokinase family)
LKPREAQPFDANQRDLHLIAISNLPWDTYYRPGCGPALEGSARTVIARPGEIEPWLDTPCSGLLEGEGAGGSPTNAALAFAGLGGAVTIVGPIAADPFGDRMRRELCRHGASLREITPRPARQAHSLAFRQDNGERRFLASHPDLEPGASAVGVDFSGPGWMLASAYELHNPAMRQIVLTGFEEAHRGGRLLAFDLADPNFTRNARAAVDQIVGLGLEVLQTGDDAVAFLLGDSVERVPAGRLGALARSVLVTRGAEGVRVCHEGAVWDLAAEESEPCDTTGAGDAFLGAFLRGRTRGLAPDRAARLGLAAAREAVRVVGTRVPLRRWAELRRAWAI